MWCISFVIILFEEMRLRGLAACSRERYNVGVGIDTVLSAPTKCRQKQNARPIDVYFCGNGLFLPR